MSEIIKIKRGLDIKLQGKADKKIIKADTSGFYGIRPTDFIGVTPKVCVKPGDPVKVGTPLFFDKHFPEMKFTSPVSGEVTDVRRGEKRKILSVIVRSDEKDDSLRFPTGDTASLSRGKITETLLESGLWQYIRQRPYSIIPVPGKTPKAIFISGFDSAPLAPDLDFIMKDSAKEFQAGIDILKKLTDGKVHLSLPAGGENCKTFSGAKKVEIHYFKGPHPAGNVGIQIHHIDPINKGDIVWYVNPQNVASIGSLFLDGKINNSLVVALTGTEVVTPAYYQVKRCTSIANILKENLGCVERRYISGNVLTGTQLMKDGFLGYYDNQVSVIPEGNYYELLGWALPGLGKYSTSRSYFSWLSPEKQFSIDTNLKGGERAFVMTGQYEKVFPMDIYPVQLIKAILAENIDKMEQLGIYEVAPEDMALCEFVCTSKIKVQDILSQGLELIRKEME